MYLVIGAVIGVISIIIYVSLTPAPQETWKVFLQALFLWPALVVRLIF